MLAKHSQIPFLLAIVILGPIFGAMIALGLFNSSGELIQPANEAAEVAQTPSIELTRANGGTIALDELAPGQRVAIVVMKGTWCKVCQKQLKVLSDRVSEIWEEDAAVFGLSTAKMETNRKLMATFDLNFPVLSDSQGQLLDKVGLSRPNSDRAVPGVVFLDEEGDISDVHRGRYPGRSQTDFIIDRLTGS